jgi:anti-sigma factor RsiW
MTNCELTEKVSLLIDGELSPAEASAVERHLLDCFQCQELRNDFLSLRREISSYSAPVDPEVQQAALAYVLRDSRDSNVVPIASRRRFAWPRFSAPAAAIAALLLVAITIGIVAMLRNRNSVGNLATEQSNSNRSVRTGSALPSSNPPNRQPQKSEQRKAGANPKKPGSRNKPPAERTAPRQIPPPRSFAPPNYAFAEPSTADLNSRPKASETLTLRHLQQAELLLRGFRNLRLGRGTASQRVTEIGDERRRAQGLVYQNIMLRREAEGSGDVQVAMLLDSLEPILLDIANLPARPSSTDVRTIQERVERKSLVALLQINSASVARAND